MLRGSKDAALAFAARTAINSRWRALGEVTDLSLDTAAQRIRLRVVLKGEPAPVDVDVRRYEVQSSDDGAVLTLIDAAASRDWLTAAIDEFLVGRPVPIPRKAAVALQLLT
jgi:hypothetical protein